MRLNGRAVLIVTERVISGVPLVPGIEQSARIIATEFNERSIWHKVAVRTGA